MATEHLPERGEFNPERSIVKTSQFTPEYIDRTFSTCDAVQVYADNGFEAFYRRMPGSALAEHVVPRLQKAQSIGDTVIIPWSLTRRFEELRLGLVKVYSGWQDTKIGGLNNLEILETILNRGVLCFYTPPESNFRQYITLPYPSISPLLIQGSTIRGEDNRAISGRALVNAVKSWGGNGCPPAHYLIADLKVTDPLVDLVEMHTSNGIEIGVALRLRDVLSVS